MNPIASAPSRCWNAIPTTYFISEYVFCSPTFPLLFFSHSLMYHTFPSFNTGPPEFPGLIAASICTAGRLASPVLRVSCYSAFFIICIYI